MSPVNFEGSVPPNVNSPLGFAREVVGSNETETRLDVIAPWLNKLSVTVGIVAPVSGKRVPSVRSTGPMLWERVSVND